jgi:hypothetical protein
MHPNNAMVAFESVALQFVRHVMHTHLVALCQFWDHASPLLCRCPEAMHEHHGIPVPCFLQAT